jgi:hypothetical protein
MSLALSGLMSGASNISCSCSMSSIMRSTSIPSQYLTESDGGQSERPTHKTWLLSPICPDGRRGWLSGSPEKFGYPIAPPSCVGQRISALTVLYIGRELTQPSATCKLLIVQDGHRLKRAGVGCSTPSLATIFIHHLANKPENSHLWWLTAPNFPTADDSES